MSPTSAPLSGRRAQAARNDDLILKSARAVFVADPTAPISAVAEHAGVGISALYRRYPSKEELLRRLCGEGLRRYITEAEAALDDDREPWEAFTAFMHRLVDADTSSLTTRLAGTFTPNEELIADATRARELGEQVFARAKEAGALRPDVAFDDVAIVSEMVASIRLGDAERTNLLRHRFLTLLLDGMHRPGTDLPGPAPTWQELGERWIPGRA